MQIRHHQFILIFVLLFLSAFASIPVTGNSTGSFITPTQRQSPQIQNLPETIKKTALQKAQTNFAPKNFDVPSKLRDNVNSYTEVWNPWLTRAGVHVTAVSDDGEFLAIGGGYLIDNTVHIYRWNIDEQEYQKVYEAGSGVISSDILDIDFGDIDNNKLIDIAVASADGRVYLFEQAHVFDPTTKLDSKFDLVWTSPKLFRATSVEFGDTDLDLINELVIGSWDQKIHVFEYNSRSGYPFAIDHWIDLKETWESNKLDDKVQSISVADMDGNQLPDIIAGTYSGSVYVYENDGAVINTPGGNIPLPNDNTYAQRWNSSNRFKPIWKPIGDIVTKDMDGDGKTESVILAWGQGAWTFKYDDSKRYYFEQLIKPFEDWQTQGFYPLDNWADFMIADGTYNVYPDQNKVNAIPQCTPDLVEPEPNGNCYPPNVNSGGSEAPDGVYSRFISNGTFGAQAIWDMGADEEIASNGNSGTDVYIIMKNGQAIPSEWEISISNDLSLWYKVNESQISVGRFDGTAYSNLEIDLDPLFSLYQISKARYIKLKLLPIDNGFTREIDSIVVPYPAQPLTLAVSATIDKLPLGYGDTTNKFIFGGTDGRLIVFKNEPQTTISYRQPDNIGNFLTFTAAQWDVTLPQTTQGWDSFTDDGFNLKETIWSIYPTPKPTFIPSWKTSSSSYSFSASSNTGFGLFSMAVFDTPLYDSPLLFLSLNSSSTDNKILVRASNNVAVDFPITGQINTLYNGQNVFVSVAVGDFISGNGAIPELITVPAQNNVSKIGTTLNFDNIYLPRLWVYDSNLGYYVLSSYNFKTYSPDGVVEDKGKTMFRFMTTGATFPTADAKDIDGDGDLDLILSNGNLLLYRNIGSPEEPIFVADGDYFKDFNEQASKYKIFQPNLWDYDQDGDYDILFSKGITSDGKRKSGLEFYRNDGTNDLPKWERKPEIVKNPTLEGSFTDQDRTLGAIEVGQTSASSADALWTYQYTTSIVVRHQAETSEQTSFIVGTNPEVMKLDVNKLTDSNNINYGYTVTDSWSNGQQFREWTSAMTVGVLDGDDNNEIIVADFDNNLYVFEHLANNTYKRAFKSQDLNHTVSTNKSPYQFQDLPGVSGNFSKLVFEHATLLISGLDADNDSKQEFALVAGLSLYVFEATGFNDEYRIIYSTYFGDMVHSSGKTFDQLINEFSSVATTPDFNGLGTMIALSASQYLFLLRYDSSIGWVETYQSIEGQETYEPLFDNPSAITIDQLLFADLNQDNKTELWVAGFNATSSKPFIVAVQSDILSYSVVYAFPSLIEKVGRINDLKISDDTDYDGKLEMVIAHEKGVDVWEFNNSNQFEPERISFISANPLYGTKNLTPMFGEYVPSDTFGSRKHTIKQLSNGKFLVIAGNDDNTTQPFPSSLLQGTPYFGELKYNIVDDPSNPGKYSDFKKVSDYPYYTDLSTSSFSYDGAQYSLMYEENPDVVEFCADGCSGSASPGFAITWSFKAVYDGLIKLYYDFIGLQLFYLNGTKMTNTIIVDTTSIRFFSNYYDGGPSIVVSPFDKTNLIVFYIINGYIIGKTFQVTGNSINFVSTFANFALGDYTVFNLDAVPIDSGSDDVVMGMMISSYLKTSAQKIPQLRFVTLNSSLMASGIYKISTGIQTEKYPSLVYVPNTQKLIVAYESQTEFETTALIAYSNDLGKSWTQGFELNQNNKYEYRDAYSAYTTNFVGMIDRFEFRPILTITNNNSLSFMFTERFVLSAEDPNYSSAPIIDAGGVNLKTVTQIFYGNIPNVDFTEYSSVVEGNILALGDTDLDGRNEILVAHGRQATLLEIDKNENGQLVYLTKWLTPVYDNVITGLEIFDANGNSWPEIIISVKGGDVFSYELVDQNQLPMSNFELTELIKQLSVNPPVNPPYDLETTAIVVSDADNDGIPDITILNSLPNATRGGVSWSIKDDTPIRDIIMNGAVTYGYYFNDTRGISNVLISDREIRIFNKDWTLQSTLTFNPKYKFNNNLLMDVNDDGFDDIVLLDETRIFAINPINGSELFNIQRLSASMSDLVQFSFLNQDYFAVTDSNFSTYRNVEIFSTAGVSIRNVTLNSYGSILSSIAFGDFDGNQLLDMAVFDYENDGTSQLLAYSLETDEVSNQNLMANITVPIKENGIQAPIQLISKEYNKDGQDEVILTVSKFGDNIPGDKNLNPFGATSAVISFNLAEETVLWERTFSSTINKVELNSGKLLVYIKDYGLQALSLNGSDMFWAYAKNPMASQILNNQIIITDFDATTYISNFTGFVTNAKNTFPVLESKVESNTTSLYQNSEGVNVFTYLVDVTNNGIDDIVVGFSNGTLALRNFEIGEYWRIQTIPFEFMYATTVKFTSTRVGMAVHLSNGQLLIFNRISPIPVINVTSPISYDLKSLVAYTVGDYQNILIAGKRSLAIFDPTNEVFIWQYTYYRDLSSIEVGAFDYQNPNTITHIINSGGSTGLELIALPSTLVPGGAFPAPPTGTWVDYQYSLQSNGLASVLLLSDTGYVTRMNWELNGTISSYSIFINKTSNSIVEQNGEILVGSSGSLTRIVDNLSSFSINSTISHDFIGSVNVALVDLNFDGTLSSVATFGNMLIVFGKTGAIQAIHSFTSTVTKLDIWIPDTSGKPVFLVMLNDGNIEFSDPFAREFSTTLAKINSFRNSPLPSQPGITVFLPDKTWTEYRPDSLDNASTPHNNYVLIVIGISLSLATVVAILRRRKL